MEYEIVSLKEKIIAGFSARTNNASPEMTNVIGGLWQRLYSDEGCPLIQNKANEKAVGMYTDYSDCERGDYTVVVGCEITEAFESAGAIELRKIPAGRYAKFIVRGNMIKAVYDFWQELWKTELDRAFICDFEEYQSSDPDNGEIHIYIGLR